jgi:hypothetical protein
MQGEMKFFPINRFTNLKLPRQPGRNQPPHSSENIRKNNLTIIQTAV